MEFQGELGTESNKHTNENTTNHESSQQDGTNQTSEIKALIVTHKGHYKWWKVFDFLGLGPSSTEELYVQEIKWR